MSSQGDASDSAGMRDYILAAAIIGTGLVLVPWLECAASGNTCVAGGTHGFRVIGTWILLGAALAFALPKLGGIMRGMADAENARLSRVEGGLRPGFLKGAPTSKVMSFRVVAGDVVEGSKVGYCTTDGLVLPVPVADALEPEAISEVGPFEKFFKLYRANEISQVDAMMDGEQRSLMSVLGTGAAVALVSPLLALGAGTAVATRKDNCVVAIVCKDGRRVLVNVNRIDMARLQFTLGTTTTLALS